MLSLTREDGRMRRCICIHVHEWNGYKYIPYWCKIDADHVEHELHVQCTCMWSYSSSALVHAQCICWFGSIRVHVHVHNNMALSFAWFTSTWICIEVYSECEHELGWFSVGVRVHNMPTWACTGIIPPTYTCTFTRLDLQCIPVGCLSMHVLRHHSLFGVYLCMYMYTSKECIPTQIHVHVHACVEGDALVHVHAVLLLLMQMSANMIS